MKTFLNYLILFISFKLIFAFLATAIYTLINGYWLWFFISFSVLEAFVILGCFIGKRWLKKLEND